MHNAKDHDLAFNSFLGHCMWRHGREPNVFPSWLISALREDSSIFLNWFLSYICSVYLEKKQKQKQKVKNITEVG